MNPEKVIYKYLKCHALCMHTEKKKITYTKARKIFISPTIRNRGRKDKESLKQSPGNSAAVL